MSYQNPGQAFIAEQGLLQRAADVERYADFLRNSAQTGDQPPIALDHIYSHFNIPIPRQAPLQDQQGILVNADIGLILIKEDDPRSRQRFTEGHELMELLFDAQVAAVSQLEGEARTQTFCPEGPYKERLCDRGSATLLMPASGFKARLARLAMSLHTGRTLAQDYQTSLIATLLRMVQLSDGAEALVMWRLGWATAEAQAQGREPPQLRPSWQTLSPGWSVGRLSKQGAAKAESVIAIAPQFNQLLTGTEILAVGQGEQHCHIEALPLHLGRQQCVLSLLHLL